MEVESLVKSATCDKRVQRQDQQWRSKKTMKKDVMMVRKMEKKMKDK